MANNELLKEEIDYADLRRKPAKLFGYVYVYFLAALVMLGLLYVWNLTPTGKNAVVPTALSDSSAFVRDIPYQSPRQIPPVNVMAVSTPTTELVARGRDLYQANCSSCHGNSGEGDGLAGVVMTPPPRNFHQVDGWTNGRRVSDIYRTLDEGIVKNGMASFSYISPADRFALAHFVRAFMKDPPVDRRDDLLALDTTYQLSKGTSTPGTIPVRKATQILVLEGRAAVGALKRSEDLLNRAAENRGAAVFARLAMDERRALYCLVVEPISARNLDEFIKTLCTDPQSLGLGANVAQLTSEEWSSLYQLIQQLKSQLAQEDRRKG